MEKVTYSADSTRTNTNTHTHIIVHSVFPVSVSGSLGRLLCVDGGYVSCDFPLIKRERWREEERERERERIEGTMTQFNA